MNREEWLKKRDRRSTVEYKKIHKLLNNWKSQNDITERCVVHHRDDTEETRKYNEEHYEFWGFNEDGTFEYGKYVIFMTSAEHSKHHHTNKNVSSETRARMSAAHKGEKFSNERRAKMSANHSHYWKGKALSEETRTKMSAATSATQKGIGVLYATYKNNGGILKWNEFRKALPNGEITFEIQPITVYTK